MSKGKDSTTVARSSKSGKLATSVTVKGTGKSIPLKGYGSVQGQLSIKKGVDLGKPISAQVAGKRAGGTVSSGTPSKKK